MVVCWYRCIKVQGSYTSWDLKCIYQQKRYRKNEFVATFLSFFFFLLFPVTEVKSRFCMWVNLSATSLRHWSLTYSAVVCNDTSGLGVHVVFIFTRTTNWNRPRGHRHAPTALVSPGRALHLTTKSQAQPPGSSDPYLSVLEQAWFMENSSWEPNCSPSAKLHGTPRAVLACVMSTGCLNVRADQRRY